MEISDIKPQKKHRRRFNIYLDGKFADGLSEETLIKFGLKIGQKITKKEWAKIIEGEEFNKALNKALRFLSFRPRTEKEIQNKLAEKKFSKEVIQKVINYLKKKHYLSDQKFIETWIQDRLNTKPEGKRLLLIELKQRGIPENEALQQLNRLLPDQKERQMARKALENAQKKYNHLSVPERKQKIIQYLTRRGFDWQIIEQLVK